MEAAGMNAMNINPLNNNKQNYANMNDVLMGHEANLWHIPDHLGDKNTNIVAQAYDRKAKKITFMVAPAHVCKGNLKRRHMKQK